MKLLRLFFCAPLVFALSAGVGIARTVGYDAAGRVVHVVQPSGEATTFSYDPNGNVLAVGIVTPGDDTDGDGIPDFFELQFSGLREALDPTLDGEGDGHDNRTEFAFALRPDRIDGFNLTPVSLSAPDPGDGSRRVYLTYDRPQAGPLHLQYTSEVSFDLSPVWIRNSPDLSETVTPLDGGIERVTVRFEVPVDTVDRVFLRIAVTPL